MERKRTSLPMALPAAVCMAFLASSCYESIGAGRDGVVSDGADLTDDRLPDFPPEITPEFPPEITPDVPIEDSSPPGAEQFCGALADALCAYFTGCCTSQELAEIMDPTELNCSSPTTSEFYTGCMSDYGDSVREGRIVVDGEGLAELEADLDSLASSCLEFGSSGFMKDFYYAAITAPALLGQVGEGMLCSEGEECLEDLYCSFYTGVCTERVRIGGVCRDDIECDPGMVCARGRCAEPGSIGDRCERGEDCGIGLWCNDILCAEALPAGAECSFPDLSCEGLCSFDPPYACRDFCNGL